VVVLILSDASSGREFYASGYSSPSDPCDAAGWIMVSTKAQCFYEATDPKPSFYYAPGNSQSNWAMSKCKFITFSVQV